MSGSLVAAFGLLLLAVGTASTPANSSWANRCAFNGQLPRMATAAKAHKDTRIDADANNIIDVFFQAAAREDPRVAELHLPAKIGKENAGIVIRALAKASGYAHSKDGKAVWKLHSPESKLLWAQPGSKSRLPPPPPAKQRGKNATCLDPERCVPGPPASVSRAAPLTEADDESMADGAMADVAADVAADAADPAANPAADPDPDPDPASEATTAAGQPSAPAKLQLTKPSTSEKPIDGKGSGFGTCARAITSRCIAEQDACDSLVTLTQLHDRQCTCFLKRVWHEKAYPSSHSMGMVNVCMCAAAHPTL